MSDINNPAHVFVQFNFSHGLVCFIITNLLNFFRWNNISVYLTIKRANSPKLSPRASKYRHGDNLIIGSNSSNFFVGTHSLKYSSSISFGKMNESYKNDSRSKYLRVSMRTSNAVINIINNERKQQRAKERNFFTLKSHTHTQSNRSHLTRCVFIFIVSGKRNVCTLKWNICDCWTYRPNIGRFENGNSVDSKNIQKKIKWSEFFLITEIFSFSLFYYHLICLRDWADCCYRCGECFILSFSVKT